jgi:hypothetical protein
MPEGNALRTANGTMSNLAIASLVLSCASIFLGPLGCLPGIVCGHMAQRAIRRNPELTGMGIATAGLVVGYVFFLAMFAMCFVLALVQFV